MRRSGLDSQFVFSDRQIHVWIVRLTASEACISRCLAWLSDDEQARAERFHFDQHRQAFVLGRAVLRALLGAMLEISPAEIRFCYGPKGKPALADWSGLLRFNSSNSGNLAAYAFTEGCELGIDVEALRPIPEMDRIAARFFAPGETSALLSLPEPDRPQGFFNCWTRKEAYIKAVGEGLSVPLDSFQVTLQPGAAAEILCLGGNTEAAKAWTLEDFAPAAGFVGAIAYPDRSRPVLFRSLMNAEELLLAYHHG